MTTLIACKNESSIRVKYTFTQRNCERIRVSLYISNGCADLCEIRLKESEPYQQIMEKTSRPLLAKNIVNNSLHCGICVRYFTLQLSFFFFLVFFLYLRTFDYDNYKRKLISSHQQHSNNDEDDGGNDGDNYCND